MRGRRGGRRSTNRNRDTDERTRARTSAAAATSVIAVTASDLPAADTDSTSAPDGPSVWRADPRYVQPADLTSCDITGCTEIAVPEEWAMLDLDTGDELPGRFCTDHELAWVTRTR